jgi:hypothetical protein
MKIPDLITAEQSSTRHRKVNIIPRTCDLIFDSLVVKNTSHKNVIAIIIARDKKKTACAVFLH